MSHNIVDTDPCFEVRPDTRAIQNTSSTKTTLIQYDHNSERFGFTLPRYIEGHDMAESTAEVHYKNGDTLGVYEMTDISVDAEDETKVKCSWLISSNATGTAGALEFLLRFSCVDADGNIIYAWNTDTFKGISVKQGMWNTPVIVEDYPDVLAQMQAELDEQADKTNALSAEITVVEGEVYDELRNLTTDDSIVWGSYYLNPSNGVAVTPSEPKYDLYKGFAEYRKLNPGDRIFGYNNNSIAFYPQVCFYDENKTFIKGYNPTNVTNRDSYGNMTGYFYTVPDNAVYFRASVNKALFENGTTKLYVISVVQTHNKVCIPNLVLDKPFKGKKILNLGDSIFGNDRKNNISSYLAEYSGATVYNGGFGGTRMSDRYSDNAYEWFDGLNLVTALTTGDWTNQETNVANVPTTYYAETLEMLKGLDMSTIDIITLAWGANDYTGGKTLSDITTALETIIDMIQAAYPSIRILVLTPTWRYFDEGDSDTVEKAAGTMLDIVEAIEMTAKKKRISVLNSYQNMPLCANTASLYLDANDQCHLNAKGNALYAHLINGKLNSIY